MQHCRSDSNVELQGKNQLRHWLCENAEITHALTSSFLTQTDREMMNRDGLLYCTTFQDHYNIVRALP